jgi:cell fate regulator YaaT (PSP1 superfamily)
LAYENEQYRVLKQKLPQVGQTVSTRLGEGKVIGGNPLKETVTVQLQSEAVVELPLSEIEPCSSNKPQ